MIINVFWLVGAGSLVLHTRGNGRQLCWQWTVCRCQVTQWRQLSSWPFSIWGSRKPRNDPSIDHLIPYPWMTLHSRKVSFCIIRWTLIHTHSRKILVAILFAFSFLYISVPVACPQNPSLHRWACFESALAPTVKYDMPLPALYYSSMVRILLG